ncbi:TetR/AcrR family transcriptional regulator [Henriciella mobilis]|uniref:TetR/AcrR family transcriptional regulator n=1 Tax=Henriciella mobilis TaxID=2305467 RepID=A0A399RIU7_9PROT|nr:TetR/AcrR family transcriptional regulator [Henriciella mobilis]RIJ30561.1 TetR/AcrR family transcriptional regulator [Henriciella mobilis]
MAEAEKTTTRKKTTRRRQGPRRSEASRAAILEATREELATAGWRKFSVDSIARRAHASKQTIYRWWPATGTMCLEAATSLLQPTQTSGTDPVERIASLLMPFEAATRTGNGHAVLRGALMAASDEKEAGDVWRNWMKSNVRAPLRLILAELAAKKRVRRDYDLDEAVNVLTSPAWHNLLIMRAPLKDGFAQEQAVRLLRVLAP